jgi:hypothetical protein
VTATLALATVTEPILLTPAGIAPLIEIEPRLTGCVACQNVPVTGMLALAIVNDPMLFDPAGSAVSILLDVHNRPADICSML